MGEGPRDLELGVLPIPWPPGQGVHLLAGELLGPGQQRENKAG